MIVMGVPIRTNSAMPTARQWEMNAEYTHYRIILFEFALPFGDTQDVYPPTTYVLVEPAAGRRVWFPLNDPESVSEAYVSEKTGAIGADARALTHLLAAALGVEPIYLDRTVEPLQENT